MSNPFSHCYSTLVLHLLVGILGVIVYVTIISGLIILDTDTERKHRDCAVMALAAFVGYNWNWAIMRFKSIGHRF